jgi:microsomal dipeptidase-like Zn-dependent dipeptidase
MHLISDPDEDLTLRHMARLRHRRRVSEWIRAWVLKKVSEEFNYPDHTNQHRVDSERMRRGAVDLGFSVLYLPLAEFQAAHWADPPQSRDVGRLEEQLELVEQEVNRQHGLRIAHDRAELDAGLTSGDTVLVHCVEGGFHLGATEREVTETVARLKGKGVVYVTLAHLFWRHVATNSNALPFLRDDQYHCFFLFHDPGVGLAPLGEAAVRAMVENHVLIDISHMSDAAIEHTFRLLGELEGDGPPTPVVSTHVATRRGVNGLDYNITEPFAREVARRRGVIGLITGDHIVTDGLRPDRDCGGRRTVDFRDSFDCLREHIDTLADWCGGYANIGIGTDLDGFVKPTIAGIDFIDDMGQVEPALAQHYGQANAELICSGNALRLLRDYVWA